MARRRGYPHSPAGVPLWAARADVDGQLLLEEAAGPRAAVGLRVDSELPFSRVVEALDRLREQDCARLHLLVPPP
ncbi:MAG: hypothetical protein QGI46_10940 [Planctomycetota bacterium]|nr:hypothetical protein [Planctomycetota bacterium]